MLSTYRPLIALLLFAASCSTNDDTALVEPASQVIGAWTMAYYQQGRAPFVEYDDDLYAEWDFTEDSVYVLTNAERSVDIPWGLTSGAYDYSVTDSTLAISDDVGMAIVIRQDSILLDSGRERDAPHGLLVRK